MKNILILFFLFFSIFLNAASMIGDVVTIRHAFPSLAETWDNPEIITVQAGTADRILYGNGYYYVNIEANQILIDFVQSGGWSDTAWNGLVVTGIDNPVIHVTTTSNWVGWSDTRVTFGDDYVYFSWHGMSNSIGTYIYATVQQVPEPSAYILFLLAIFLFWIKK